MKDKKRKKKFTGQEKNLIKLVKFLGSLTEKEFKTVKKMQDKLNKVYE